MEGNTCQSRHGQFQESLTGHQLERKYQQTGHVELDAEISPWLELLLQARATSSKVVTFIQRRQRRTLEGSTTIWSCSSEMCSGAAAYRTGAVDLTLPPTGEKLSFQTHLQTELKHHCWQKKGISRSRKSYEICSSEGDKRGGLPACP